MSAPRRAPVSVPGLPLPARPDVSIVPPWLTRVSPTRDEPTRQPGPFHGAKLSRAGGQISRPPIHQPTGTESRIPSWGGQRTCRRLRVGRDGAVSALLLGGGLTRRDRHATWAGRTLPPAW